MQNCKYCGREIYYGVFRGTRYFYNMDDYQNHTCPDYYASRRQKLPETMNEVPKVKASKDNLRDTILGDIPPGGGLEGLFSSNDRGAK